MEMKLINKKKRKGFTLIELIVVIAIIGILAAIAIPRLTGFQDKAKVSADIANVKVLDQAIQVQVADEGTALVATVSSTSTPTAEDINNIVAALITSEYLPANTKVVFDNRGKVTVTGTTGAVTGVVYTK